MDKMPTTDTSIVYAGVCCYRDAPKMLDWLEGAFGFKKHVVYTGDDGKIVHAEMAVGQSILNNVFGNDPQISKLLDQEGRGLVGGYREGVVIDNFGSQIFGRRFTTDDSPPVVDAGHAVEPLKVVIGSSITL